MKYLEHDIAFHRVVLNAGNEMFARLGDVVAEILTGRTHHQVMFDDPDPAAVTLHVQVAEAVREGDGARAEEITRQIVVGALAELDVLAPQLKALRLGTPCTGNPAPLVYWAATSETPQIPSCVTLATAKIAGLPDDVLSGHAR